MPLNVSLAALPGIPVVQPGDDLALLITEALDRAELRLEDGDALVVTSKIVSKAEGRQVDLRTVQPGDEALRLASLTGKDSRMVELALRESVEVSRYAPNTLITRHRLGFVSANAGIDQSNVDGDDDHALLLPINPDESARRLRERLYELKGARVGIVISDSHGRPFRLGNIGVAVGVAGMPALVDLRGQPDMFGRILKISIQGYADMVASAAGLLSGEGGEGLPVVLVRGLDFPQLNGRAVDLYRPAEGDLYR